MRLRYFWSVIPLLFFIEGASAKCRLDATVYFANGMFNEYSEANESLSALRKVITDQYPKNATRVQKWKIAYNTNEPILRQIWQVFDEKRNEVKGNFWSSIFELLGQSEWARLKTTSILKQISKEQILKDADLRKQLLEYVGDLKHCLVKRIGAVEGEAIARLNFLLPLIVVIIGIERTRS